MPNTPNPRTFLLILFFCLLFNACGSGSTSDVVDDSDDDAQINDTVNTAKLVGTPFEGLETGDDLYWEMFLEDEYETTTVDELPIPVFLAFFTLDEETIIQEGIDIANEAIGAEVFVVTEVWTDEVRPIIKVNEISDPTYLEGRILSLAGKTNAKYYNFNGNSFSEKICTDWQIEIKSTGITKWVVAHELGHAFAIRSHALIDYENDTIVDLEENSLMEAAIPDNPLLTDYIYMMQRQGEILLDHLGEQGAVSLIRGQ